MEEIIKNNFVEISNLTKPKQKRLIYKNNSGFKYYIDKKGNLVRKKIHPIFNKYTLFSILIILSAYMFTEDTRACKVTLNHLDTTCEMYLQAKSNLLNTCDKDISGACKVNMTGIIINMTSNYSLMKEIYGK